MTRLRAAQLRVSPLHIQQGLFAVLALLITLIAVQQYQHWEQGQEQEAPHVSIQHPIQTHFSAVSTNAAESTSLRMMDVDQAQTVDAMPQQERWVF